MTDFEKIGVIYILSNPSLRGMVKIGWTSKSATARAEELSASTSIPTPFKVEHEFWVEYPQSIEAKIFRLLKEVRVNLKREFFSLSADQANAKIGNLLHGVQDETEILMAEAANVLRLFKKYPDQFAHTDLTEIQLEVRELMNWLTKC